MLRQSLRLLNSQIHNQIEAKLKKAFPDGYINIVDTSGGCGSFFKIEITSGQFNGKRTVMQHKIVNQVLQRVF